MAIQIAVDQEKLATLCRRHGIRRLALFGSILEQDFAPESDVDILVEFQPGQTLGFRVFDIEDELASLFGGHRVDLVNQKYLNHRLRDRILETAEVQYAER